MNAGTMSSIDDLSVFKEVVAANSFVGAAKHLGMTPSGVSRKISRFEERLGVRLFHRTTRSLSLTEAGHALSEQSISILASIEAAEATVRDLSSTPRGVLRIAASDAFTQEVIVPFLPGFLDQYPELSVTVLQGDGGIDLLNERVDVALMFERPDETSFIVKKIVKDPWIVCASPSYFEQHGEPAIPEDLYDHKCLTIHARGRTRDHWKFVKNGSPLTINVASRFSSIGLNVKAAALEGLGVARLAHFLVCPDIERGLLNPALVEFMPQSERCIYAVYPNRQHLASKARVFMDSFIRYVRESLPVPAELA